MNIINQTCSVNFFVGRSSAAPPSGTDSKIRSFGKLDAGWHYGRGGPVDDSIITIAREYLSLLLIHGFAETEAFPGAAGEILVAAYRGKHCLEVIVEVDKKFSVSHEFDGQDLYRESELSGMQACDAIRKITATIEQEECNISSWSTYDTIATAKVGSSTWLLGHQATALVPQSFLKNVACRFPEVFVHTSTNTTPVLAGNRQFSGGLIRRQSLPLVISNNQTPTAETIATTK